MRGKTLFLVLGLAALFGVRSSLASPAAPNRTTVEAVVVKIGGADKKGHPQITLKIVSATGSAKYKKGFELAVVPQKGAALKVNDTIHADTSMVGDEWHNHVRLFHVTILKRRSPVPFQVVKPGVRTLKPIRLVIRSGKEWMNKMSKIVVAVAGKMFVPKVDYDKNMALFVSMGMCGSNGHGIRITKIEDRLREIVVSVKTRSPKPGQAAGKVITYPTHMVTVAKSDLPVRFVAEGDEDKPFAVPFKVLARKWNGGLAKPQRIVISDAKRWADTWKRMKAKAADLPKIDFGRKTVIALFLGPLTQTGGRSEIVRVVRTPDAVEVFVRKIDPDIQMDALSNPYFIAAIDTAGFPVRFIETVTILRQISGRISKVEKARNRVIKTKKEWDKLVAQLGPSKRLVFRPNFARQMVIATFAGKRKPGASMEFQRIEKRQGKLYVEVFTTIGERGKGRETTPFALALIEKSDLPVEYRIEDVVVVEAVRPLPYAVGRLIVLFHKNVPHAEQLKVIKEIGCTPGSRFKSINGYLVNIPKEKIPADREGIEKAMEAFLKKFKAHPKIKSAEFDHIMSIQPVPPQRGNR